MKLIIKILFLFIPFWAFSQESEGGGAYIRNNGKLINCIVRENYASNGFGVAGTAGDNQQSLFKQNNHASRRHVSD